jgi:HEAT repeat protein
LGQLLQSLDEAAVYPTEEELGELFREFRPEALETLLKWLPRLTNERVKELVGEAAQRLAQAHPEAVASALKAREESVLLQAAKMAGTLRLPPAVPALGALLAEGSPQVKVAAVEALAAIGSPGAIQELERAIDDPERDVRVTAVRALGQRGARRALAKIEARVNEKQLRAADLTEKMAFFEAYGLLAGKDGVKTLTDLLFSGGFLKRKEDAETRACAAMALGKIGTPEARHALELALKDKDPLVRNAATKALKELR